MITLSFILLVFDTIYYNYNLHISTEGCNEFVWDSKSGLPLVEEHKKFLQSTLIVVKCNQYVYYKNSYTHDKIILLLFPCNRSKTKDNFISRVFVSWFNCIICWQWTTCRLTQNVLKKNYNFLKVEINNKNYIFI